MPDNERRYGLGRLVELLPQRGHICIGVSDVLVDRVGAVFGGAYTARAAGLTSSIYSKGDNFWQSNDN